jgi:hypothetical protein
VWLLLKRLRPGHANGGTTVAFPPAFQRIDNPHQFAPSPAHRADLMFRLIAARIRLVLLHIFLAKTVPV